MSRRFFPGDNKSKENLGIIIPQFDISSRAMDEKEAGLLSKTRLKSIGNESLTFRVTHCHQNGYYMSSFTSVSNYQYTLLYIKNSKREIHKR